MFLTGEVHRFARVLVEIQAARERELAELRRTVRGLADTLHTVVARVDEVQNVLTNQVRTVIESVRTDLREVREDTTASRELVERVLNVAAEPECTVPDEEMGVEERDSGVADGSGGTEVVASTPPQEQLTIQVSNTESMFDLLRLITR